MPVTLEEFYEIKQKARCAKFINTNLHLHTPATPQDWNSCPNQTIKAEDLTPELYFEHLNKTTLELVAITDHNTISWCEPLMKLARDGRKNGTSNLRILPGVEITTYEGPHLIAIFPEDFGILHQIQNFLTKLGLSGTGNPEERVSRGEEDQITIKKIIRMVVELGGLVIGPHIHSKDGVWGHSAFRGREDILNDPHFRILAAPSGDIKLITLHDRRRFLYKNMPCERILNSFAFINVSDCHRIDDFELDSTWIKVSEPTLEGVKQIIYEPELRISHRLVDTDSRVEFPITFEFATPPEVTHAHILGMVISGGMFNNQIISFSPHQNSIIGKNYAGKSSILDCLRFVIEDLSSIDEESRHKLAVRLRGILTDGGQVRAYVSLNRKYFALSRTLSTTRAKTNFEIEGDTEVYALIGDEFRRQSDLSAHDVIGLESYAQGEVVRIKDNSNKQMTLLDSLSNVGELLRDVMFNDGDGITLLSKLVINSNEIIKLDDEVISLGEETQSLDDLQAEITGLEELAKSPLLDEIKQWGEAENSTAGLIRQLRKLREGVGRVREEIPDYEQPNKTVKQIEINKASCEELTDYASQVFYSTISNLSESLQGTMLDSTLADLELVKSEIHSRGEVAADRFIGDAGENSTQAQLAELITEKKGKLDYLLERQEKLLQCRSEVMKLEKNRTTLLEEFSSVWENIRLARKRVVEIINKNSAANIQAELVEAGDRTLYRAKLDDIAVKLTSSSNKISNKQTQLDLVAESVDPEQLISIVKTGDVAKLVTDAHVTDNTARVLIGMGKSDLHELEISKLQDKFVIKYLKEGDENFTPIDSGLSGGEQALALLSVALVPKEMPLLIDQPEDELGTALITKDLVEQIRTVKNHRQLILVTHVANIPVLADSEYVIYVQQKISEGDKKITSDVTGSLENKEIIARLLELDGGKYAFAKRNERYSVLISGDVIYI